MPNDLPEQSTIEGSSIVRQVCSPIVGQYIISSPYNLQRKLDGKPKPHYGTDFVQTRGGGDPLFAMGHGIVENIVTDEEAAREGLNQGESITIRFSQEFRSIPGAEKWAQVKYFHLWPGTIKQAMDEEGFKQNSEIDAGTWIGRIGSTGGSKGAHLHLEILNDRGQKLDISDTDFYKLTRDQAGSGVYRRDGEPDDVRPPVEKYPPAQGEAGGTSNPGGIATFSAKDAVENVDDDEIRTSIISLLMHQIIERQIVAPKQYKNFFALNGGSNTALLPNYILGKEFKQNYNELENIELANMVPYVELYNIRVNTDSQNNRIFTETAFPFDDYTQQTKLESIFYDRTGRGGNIGLKSVEWKSLATNMSNQSFIEATVKIIIQDIQDIEVFRNGITLLDFLYPGGNTVSQEFSPVNFNVKMKVGWKYKKESNPLLSQIDQKIIEDNLSETLYLTLTNHRFEFTEDGVCELTIDYKGMIESELENQNDYNVLDFLSPNKKLYERRVKIWKRLLEVISEINLKSPREIYHFIQSQNNLEKIFEFRAEVSDTVLSEITSLGLAGYGEGLKKEEAETFAKPYSFPEVAFRSDNPPKIFVKITTERAQEDPGFFDWVKSAFNPPEGNSGYYEVEVSRLSGQEKLKSKLAKIIQDAEDDLARSYLPGISNLLQNVDINYISLDKKTVDELKKISTVSTVLNKNQAVKYEKSIENIINNKNIINSLNPRPTKVKESLRKATSKNVGISSEKFTEELFKNTNSEDSYMNVPYVFLRDILQYYIELFSGSKDSLPNDFFTAIGSFSYNNFGSTQKKNVINNIGIRRTPKAPRDSAEYHQFEKKYANMADIPIPVDALISWYSSHIMDANIKKMGYLDFLKSMFNNILKASLKNSIISYAPQRTIIPSFNFITLDAGKKDYQTAVDYFDSKPAPWKDERSKYLFNVNYDIENKQLLQTCLFYKMKRYLPESKNISTGTRKSFLIILAKNEKDNSLISDYKEDLEKSIPHFYIGDDSGLVKLIKFSRQDNQKLESANILRANNSEYDSAIIRQIYNLDLKMHGNNLLSPGQFVHITPTYPGSRLKNPTLYQIGLGGYFVVNQISNTIEENNFETTIKAQWQMYGDGLEQKLGNDGIIKVVDAQETD